MMNKEDGESNIVHTSSLSTILQHTKKKVTRRCKRRDTTAKTSQRIKKQREDCGTVIRILNTQSTAPIMWCERHQPHCSLTSSRLAVEKSDAGIKISDQRQEKNNKSTNQRVSSFRRQRSSIQHGTDQATPVYATRRAQHLMCAARDQTKQQHGSNPLKSKRFCVRWIQFQIC